MIQENISLKQYNTFGIDAIARYYASVASIDALREMKLVYDQLGINELMILGGGSNILLTNNFNGLVLKNNIDSIQQIDEDDEYVYVLAGAGVNWHSFVLYCIANNFAGVENLSLIPGNVGASPMQNIGAYGVEIKDVFHSLEAYHLQENTLQIFSKQDCEFGYRESVFKGKYKGQYAIVSVTFKLAKQPIYNISYGAIGQELEAMGVSQLSIAAISQAVINIRSSKLPDPAVTGNAGSFFKNPAISNDAFLKLKTLFPQIVGYDIGNGQTKLAAGWLIEHCGPRDGVSWKGYRVGDAGCHAKQALVLVNYGHAKGEEIYELSTAIISSVNEKFGVVLEREVNII